MRSFVLLALAACFHGSSSPSPPPPPANVVVAPAPDAAPETEEPARPECERYERVYAKLDSCTRLSQAARQQLDQTNADLTASVGENGLDGSFIDPERACAEAYAQVIQTALVPCGW